MAIAGCGKSSILLLIATRASHHRSISCKFCKPVYRIDIKGPRNGSHLLYYARRATAARILYRYERKTRSAHIGHPARGRLLSISGSLVHKRKRAAPTQAMELWIFGSCTPPPHSRCSVPSCCVQFVVEGQPRPGIGDFRGSTMPETRARVSVSFRAPVSSEGSTSLAQTIGR